MGYEGPPPPPLPLPLRDEVSLLPPTPHPSILKGGGGRMMGVASKLVSWLHKSARVAGCEYIELQVRSDNQIARRFYRNLGYSDEALLPGYYDGKVSAYQVKLRLHSA